MVIKSRWQKFIIYAPPTKVQEITKKKEKLYNRKYTCIKNDNEITIFTATATAATVLVFAFSLGSQGAIIIPMI